MNYILINGMLHAMDSITLPLTKEHREFWLDPVEGVVGIDAAAALASDKSYYSKQIDIDAEDYRIQFITPGYGMAMTYREKFDQARAASISGQAAVDALTASDGIAEYPTLAASVGLEAGSIWEVALLVISKAEAWADLSYIIERKRLTGKAAIEAATDSSGVLAAYNAVTWG